MNKNRMGQAMNWSALLDAFRGADTRVSDELMDAVIDGVKNRRVVTVFLPHAPNDYRRSFFVGIDQKNRPGFYLDMLLPSPRPRLLTPDHTEAIIRFTHKDSPHEMTAVYAGTEYFDGFPSLKFHPPQNLTNLQRRKYYRVEPKTSEPVEIAIENETSESSALDISLGGVRFYASKEVNEGEHFGLRVKIPNKPVSILDAHALVRSCVPVDGVKHAHKTRPYCVRAEFDGIDPKTVHELNKYLFNRQREIGQMMG